MTELKKDMTDRRLGKSHQVCRICGAKGEFDTYQAREMMQGTRDEFLYFACDRCKCLQIATVPENLNDYYGSDYYSFQMQEAPDMEFDVPVSNSRKILDVGCGSGAWLVEKAKEGWGNLYGCDPFLEKERHYGQRVHIRNCTIHEMDGDGTFDIIRMSDSFEHMEDPLEVLRSARRLLKQDGILYMTIPTYPNIAFERFGAHWYQLDAPRHIFLHSRESLQWLARASGMEIFDIRYNSNDSQFVRSWLYQHGIPFFEQNKLIGQYFQSKDFEKMEKEAAVWNEKEYGDHMEVYWKRNVLSAAGEGKKVIFQRFSGREGRRLSPYPPVYREPDADYICFTDNPTIQSQNWKIQLVDDLECADLERYLEKYDNRWELQPEQIQMGPLFGGQGIENLIAVPALEELPLVEMDLKKFEPTADENGNYVYRRNPVYQKGRYNGRPLLLTIGVPVSNQIDTIDRCLSHIKPLLDGLDAELLVIDTGSTDGTVEVCRSYGARVISHAWCDNMSVVRNEGIYHARGQWYMSIDDDEWFEDVEEILLFFKQGTYRSYDAATYIQRNYMDSEGKIYEDHHTTRMAEITPTLHFEGRIHDALILHGRIRSYMLQSYAHHYGFVNDRPEKVKEKFMRNASILLYDVYEYPTDLRYLFQLANEYSCVHSREVAISLFAQTMALAKEAENSYRGNISLIKLLDCLYSEDDVRLFSWTESLKDLFSLTVAERAGIEWSREVLAFQMKKPAGQVLAYFESYKKMLQEYNEDPGASKYLTFHGLAKVEHEFFVMDANAIGFCSYLKTGEEEKALELLSEISLEIVENRRIAVLAAGFAGEELIFEALCGKLTAEQWEEWSGEVLDAMAVSLTRDVIYSRQADRFSCVLDRLSVPSVISWAEQSRKRAGKTGQKLFQYAMEHVSEDSPVQELCLCAWILKEAYVQNRGRENGKKILYQYISVMGVFAERYYNPEQLTNPESRVIPPDIRATYRMAVALADGRPSSENVALLKQALVIFPGFHEEIRSILMVLTRSER